MEKSYIVKLPAEQVNLEKFDVEVGQPVQHIFLADKSNLKRIRPGNLLKFKYSDKIIAVCKVNDYSNFYIGSSEANIKEWLTEEMAIPAEKLQERNPKYKGIKISVGGEEMDMTDFNPLWYADFYKYFKQLHGHKKEWSKSWTEAIMTWMTRVE